ncbi:formyltransferase family protein [Shinella zoogloeoides]
MTAVNGTIVVCADGYVGKQIVEWLSTYHPESVSLVITVSENDIFQHCQKHSIPVEALNARSIRTTISSRIDGGIDLGILLWWPKILSKDDINIATKGFINTHPSLLPFHRGKNPNFWALKNGEPFGVSIHFLGSGIDDGDIIAQKQVPYSWTDNAGDLYKKSLESMIDLFKSTFSSILHNDVTRSTQDMSLGNFHYAREMDNACHFQLNQTYSARDFLNLLRARTFGHYPACWFTDEDGTEYEVRISITPRAHS